MAVGSQHLVGMAEIKVASGPAKFTCLGLGSCIGLVALDEQADVCGMIHIMLPEAFKDKPVDKPGKFADTGIPELLRQLESLGAQRNRLVISYAGGAQVFKFGSDSNSRMDVGLRNAEAVAVILKSLGLRPLASDVGGSSGRTVTVLSEDGLVNVRTVNGGEKSLCCLRRNKKGAAA
ncbi:MAG: chemotaxis protein CheD [Armatimonadetes bacterium]|nr:chemotaxis protein CheD [Armatimonadota bacterium]MBS1710773.1 chemotaxis protein CheD [Armatimonadota bacterium]MBX3108444.1 chemotaxis protein CheD [Fimbriimonadaceae bacterium]